MFTDTPSVGIKSYYHIRIIKLAAKIDTSATQFSIKNIRLKKLIQLRPLIRIVRTAHRQCLHAMRTDDVIQNADAKNPSESGIGNPIANSRVGNPNAAYTVDAV
ncbi:hypothetical protein SFRURICE_015462 [Spodoptera frugiperda]|nr:hypothetical protein SFRURICE_015462 [Spodoptera frugiperda]